MKIKNIYIYKEQKYKYDSCTRKRMSEKLSQNELMNMPLSWFIIQLGKQGTKYLMSHSIFLIIKIYNYHKRLKPNLVAVVIMCSMYVPHRRTFL